MVQKTEIHKRTVGSVMIFDLFGDLTVDEIDAIKDFMEANIQKGGVRNVILNTEFVTGIDDLALRKLLIPLERPHRKAVYCLKPEIENIFKNAYLPEGLALCTNEAQLAEAFGLYLVEKDKFIFKGERRKSKRIEVALPLQIDVEDLDGKAHSLPALITNLSEGGFYVEFITLRFADAIREIRDLRSRPATVTFTPPMGSSEQIFKTELLRTELSSRQTGLAARFIKE